MTEEQKLKQKLKKMKERYEQEREKVKAYKQIVKIYGSYMALMLEAMGATKDKPFKMRHSDISKALAEKETYALPTNDGFKMYFEIVKENEKDA